MTCHPAHNEPRVDRGPRCRRQLPSVTIGRISTCFPIGTSTVGIPFTNGQVTHLLSLLSGGRKRPSPADGEKAHARRSRRGPRRDAGPFCKGQQKRGESRNAWPFPL